MGTKKQGPHGEFCGCNPDGVYVGLGCPNPNRPLEVIKLTTMQMMLMDLEDRQRIYEEAGMFESATALVTSIESAKNLIQMEKEQIKDAWKDSSLHRYVEEVLEYSAEEYYNEQFGK